jgi:hypothetical protein
MVDIMRVKTVLSGFSGGPGFNQLYFGVASQPPTGASAVLATTRVKDAWTAARTLFPGSWTATVDAAVDTVQISDGTITGALAGAPFTITGNAGAGSDYGPSPSGLLVEYRTGGVVNSHHVRGRSFLVPLASNTLGTAGKPTSTAMTVAAAFATALLNTAGADCFLGIWARPFTPKPGDTTHPARAGSFHAVTVSSVPNEFVVLRSRRD